jgi:hypothetical protein
MMVYPLEGISQYVRYVSSFRVQRRQKAVRSPRPLISRRHKMHRRSRLLNCRSVGTCLVAAKHHIPAWQNRSHENETMRIASCSSYTDNRLHIRFLLIEHVRIPYGDPLSADAAAFVPPTFGLAEIPVALPARDDDDGVRPSWPYCRSVRSRSCG